MFQTVKYFARKTMTVEEKLEVTEVTMPYMTICSEEPYKAIWILL